MLLFPSQSQNLCNQPSQLGNIFRKVLPLPPFAIFAFFSFSKSNDAVDCKNILFFTFDVCRLYQINRRLITQALSWTAGDCWRWRNPQLNLKGARAILGKAIGMAPKYKNAKWKCHISKSNKDEKTNIEHSIMETELLRADHLLWVYSKWTRNVRKMRFKGYNWKTAATRGCLGFFLLLISRKWAYMNSLDMLLFLLRVVGLLLWATWINSLRGQNGKNAATGTVFCCLNCWELLRLLVSLDRMNESIWFDFRFFAVARGMGKSNMQPWVFWFDCHRGYSRYSAAIWGYLGQRLMLIFCRRLDTFRRMHKRLNCYLFSRFSVGANTQGHFWKFEGLLGCSRYQLLLLLSISGNLACIAHSPISSSELFASHVITSQYLISPTAVPIAPSPTAYFPFSPPPLSLHSLIRPSRF
ncbi:hypothetical protein LXL04_003647 [Taraxacum kok-saghyz]